MPTTPFLLKVPDDILARLRTVAKARGVSVAALLLDPWRDGEAAASAPAPRPHMPRSATVVASPKRQRVDVVAPKSARLTMADVRPTFTPRLKPEKGSKK